MNKPDTKFVYDKPTPVLPIGTKVYVFNRPKDSVMEGTIIGALFSLDEEGYVDEDYYKIRWSDPEEADEKLSMKDFFIDPQQALDKEISRNQSSINFSLTTVQIETNRRHKLEEMRKLYNKEDNNVD